jgi:hypothetical protein
VFAPVLRLTARSFPGKVPLMISRPLTTAASRTIPLLRPALKAVSTAPVVGLSFTRPRRETPLTLVKVPPTYSELFAATIAQTWPLMLGANDWMTPVAALNATMLDRVTVPPPTPAAGVTELNSPPAYRMPLTSAIL